MVCLVAKRTCFYVESNYRARNYGAGSRLGIRPRVQIIRGSTSMKSCARGALRRRLLFAKSRAYCWLLIACVVLVFGRQTDTCIMHQHMHYGALGLLKYLQSGPPLLYSKCQPSVGWLGWLAIYDVRLALLIWEELFRMCVCTA